MGALTWVVAALAAAAIGRRSPVGIRRSLILEISVAVAAALFFGAIATVLDFGGWAEPDWRSATFALLGALAAVGAARIRTHSAPR